MNERPWTTDSPSDASGSSSRDEPLAAGLAPEDGLAVDRRGFLKVLGFGAAASLAACERVPVHHVLPFTIAPEHVRAGLPVEYAGTCTACEARCGLLATVRDGRPIKLEGHPDDPRTRGGLCAVGQADLRALYDPDRLRAPTAGGQPTSWTALDQTVRRQLDELREQGLSFLVVTGRETSPTARRLIESFVTDRGQWIEIDLQPQSPQAPIEAYQTLTGSRLQPVVDWSQVDQVVSFSSDYLGAGADPVANTRGVADRRRQAKERGALTHVQIEGSRSLTGAAADRRLAANADERRSLALRLLGEVAARTSESDLATSLKAALSGLSEDEVATRRAQTLAVELLAAGPKGVVVCGDDDPTEQLAVAAINHMIGAVGRSLRLEEPLFESRPRSGVGALRAALADESLGGILTIDVDPVRQLSDGEAVAQRIAALPLSVAISARPTATTRACRLVAAAHHGLECWGDHQRTADRLQIQQPMIQPLFESRAPYENLLQWSGADATDYRTHLKESWEAHVPRPEGVGFDQFWHESVAAGATALPVSEGVASPSFDWTDALAAFRRSAAAVPAPATSVLELELLAEVALRDGRRAHVPWLRELPDPLTRVSWVPVFRISPALAERQGIEDGDELEVQIEERSIRLPARILPGQAEGVVGMPIGYGGEGEDPAWNAYRLTTLAGEGMKWTVAITSLRKTGAHEKLPLMQVWSSTEGRPIVYQVSKPDEAVHAPHHPAASLWKDREKKSPQWHMSIDLDACTGCGACVVACQVENNIPVVGEQGMRDHRDMHWLRIDRYFMGEADDPDVLFEPMMCAQCDHAPCETVCPVTATAHSADGLNQQAYNRCVGTRYCANNCPYKVRRFNWFDYRPKDPVEQLVLNPEVVVRSRGVMEKCTFCVQRIQSARLTARKSDQPGAPKVQTACQQSCPGAAIRFGDATDPEGDIATDRHEPRAFQVLAELGIEPSITYLARVRNRASSEADSSSGSKPHGG